MKIPHEIKKLSDCVQKFFFDNSDKSPNFKDIFQITSEHMTMLLNFYPCTMGIFYPCTMGIFIT